MRGLDLRHDQHASHVPLDRMVESHLSLDVHQLVREGLLVPGVRATIGEGDRASHLAVRDDGIVELDGKPIQVSWHPALPLRCWICPQCKRDRYKLHRVNSVWACRKCHQLSYLCRHFGRTVPGLSRIRQLRRRIGASLVPFSPLPHKPPLVLRKHWLLCREIRRLEARLIQHGHHDVALMLEDRDARS